MGLWFFLPLWSVLWWRKLRGLCKPPDGLDLQREKLGLVLVGRALLSKTLIQLYVDGWGYIPFWYLFGFRGPSTEVCGFYGRVNSKLQEGLHQGRPSRPVAASGPVPVVRPCQPRTPQETLQHLQVVLVQSPMGSLLLSSGSWCTQDFVCTVQDRSLFPPVLWKSYSQFPLVFKVRFAGDSQSHCWIPRLGTLVWGLEPS